MAGKREDQKVCRKSKCRSAFRAGFDAGRYLPSSSAKLSPKTPDFIGSKQPLKTDRTPSWRIVATGVPITANFYHCTTVPDGPNCQWDGGEDERIEARNRERLSAAKAA
jgi:hypothetical protein